MADLRLNPTYNRHQVNEAFQQVVRDRPGLAKAFGSSPVDIRLGHPKGKGFAETFLPGEIGPPNKPAPGNPDQLRIELRQARGQGVGELKNTLVGELLHQMGGADIKGQPFNEEFLKLKNELIDRMTPEQIEEQLFFYKRDKANGLSGTNFESFENALRTSYGDAFIRGDLIPSGLTHPEERARYERRDGTGQFNPEQIETLDKIRGLVNGDVEYTEKMKEFRKIFDPPAPDWLLKAASALSTASGLKKPKKAKQNGGKHR
jgi:hypothetical protein